MKYYKVLNGDRSCHGGSQVWPLPTADGPGEWLEFLGNLEPCRSGFHVTSEPAKWFDRSGLSVYEVEIEGEQVPCGDDKTVCRKLRLAKLLTEAELNAVQVFNVGEHKVDKGFSRAYDSATVEAYGSATVRAYDSATVRAYDSATVEAYGSATVEASDSATVRAYDSATVEAYGSATVNSYDQRNKITLHSVAIQIDRSACGKVTIRHAANAAVTLEQAKEQQ